MNMDQIECMLCALSHYPLNLSGGGSVRALNVWKILAEIYGEDVVAYALASNSEQVYIEGILERHIKKPFLFDKVPAGYLCVFPELIRSQLSSANIFETTPSVIISEGPYMGYATLRTLGFPNSSLHIYDAQNVETNYHKQYFNRNPLKKSFLKKIESIERYVMDNSHYIFSTSEEESQFLQDRYKINRDKIILLPNGVDTSVVRPLERSEKVSTRRKVGISGPVVIFMGSRIKANVVTGKWICEQLAAKMPEVTFLIIGNVSNDLQTKLSNVKILGRLANSEKNEMLQVADVAINPVQFGAGTNVKMLEYLASALPIVSTDIGTRGLDLEDRKEVIISDLEHFHLSIREILRDESLRTTLEHNCQRKAQVYDWRNIAHTVKIRLAKTSIGR